MQAHRCISCRCAQERWAWQRSYSFEGFESGDLLSRHRKWVGARVHAPLPLDRPGEGVAEVESIAPAQLTLGLGCVEDQHGRLGGMTSVIQLPLRAAAPKLGRQRRNLAGIAEAVASRPEV